MILYTYIISLSVISTSCFILGFYTLFADKSSIKNRLFFLNSMLLNLVIICTILIQVQNSADNVLLVQEIYNIILIVFLLESLWFNLCFSRSKLDLKFKIILIPTIATIIMFFILCPETLLSVSNNSGMWTYKLTNIPFWFIIYSPMLFLLVFLMIRCLFIFSKNASTQKEKIQAKIISISILTSFGGGFFFLMLLPLLSTYIAPLLTPYFFAIYIYGNFFAITRYKFLTFSIKDIANEALSHIQDIVLIIHADGTVFNSNGILDNALSGKTEILHDRCIFDFVENTAGLKSALSAFMHSQSENLTTQINFLIMNDRIITDSYISKIFDKFGDFSGILIIAKENRGIKQFQKFFKITDREMDVIFNAISGSTNHDTAIKLNITENTVKTHLTNIFNKLGIGNKIGLIRISQNFGFFNYNKNDTENEFPVSKELNNPYLLKTNSVFSG